MRNWRWLYLGERGGKHIYVSNDRVAAAVLPSRIIDEAEESSSYAYAYLLEVVEEICKAARASPYIYVLLPRDAPPLLHLYSNGELWLAVDDWPSPHDILRLGRIPYSGPPAVCSLEYALDIKRRVRAHGMYVSVVRRHSTIFHFTLRNAVVITAEKVW